MFHGKHLSARPFSKCLPTNILKHFYRLFSHFVFTSFSQMFAGKHLTDYF